MRILIVETDEQYAESLSLALQREGYEVDCLLPDSTMEEKMLLFQNTYDLIVFDRMFADLSGRQVRNKVRARKVKIPLLVLTRGANEEALPSKTGSSEYVAKPESSLELLSPIEKLLEQPVEVVYEEVNVGGLILNESTRQVFTGRKNVSLTHTEFEILEYLIIHAGSIITRDLILSHVWGQDTETSSNVVDTHIKNIRKKINGDKNIIETVRGQGYRIRE